MADGLLAHVRRSGVVVGYGGNLSVSIFGKAICSCVSACCGKCDVLMYGELCEMEIEIDAGRRFGVRLDNIIRTASK